MPQVPVMRAQAIAGAYAAPSEHRVNRSAKIALRGPLD